MRLAASFQMIFRKPKDTVMSFNSFRQQAWLCLWHPVGLGTDIWLDHLGCCWTGRPREKCHPAEGWRTGTEEDAVCMPPPRKASSGLASCVHILWAFFSLSSTGSIGYDSGVTAHWTFSFCFSVVRHDILRDFIEQQVLLLWLVKTP